MKDLEKKLKEVAKSCSEALKKARSIDKLEEIRVAYLGRKGVLAELTDQFKLLSTEEKRTIGPLLQGTKKSLQEQFDSRKTTLETKGAISEALFDVTAYKPHQLHGSMHICSQMIEELSNIFISMGYQIVDGPEMETDHYNFGTLNIPADHPARDSHDTFWLTTDRLLRTHTSSVQAHTMEATTPPLAIFAPGRVYRNEALDASHEFMFSQAEGLLIDKDVSMANLLATAKSFLRTFFGKHDLEIRVRPGYFPFVEPGIEIDGSCPFCKDGCSICKHTTWIELMGAGLVHPNVLQANGIDAEKYSGFAFGFGIERLIMIKYGITDIRLFHSANIQFLDQFA